VKARTPLDYLQQGITWLLSGMTTVIYAAFALLVALVGFGFVYALLAG
jgi:hypothetical protein